MPNQYGRPVTNEDYEPVRESHAQGLGRNEIARRIGRAQRTVSVIAAELGPVFDTSMTEDATRARLAQLAALRADTAVDLHLDALRLTQQMWEPAVVSNFGGRENSYNEREVNEPPAGDKKNLMASAGIALEKSLKLVPDDAGASDARSMPPPSSLMLAQGTLKAATENRRQLCIVGGSVGGIDMRGI